MEAPMSSPQQGQEVPSTGEESATTAAATTAATTAAATATDAGDVADVEQDGKKRKFDHDAFRSSKYFKICSIVKELRPFFVEVSRTPNFRDSKAAHEIQIRMKTLVELTKQLYETSSITKCSETSAKEPLSTVVKEENVEEQQKEGKQASQSQPGDEPAALVNAAENGIRGSLEQSLLNNGESISEK